MRVSALRDPLRWMSLAACALVVLGFALFALEETSAGSREQVAEVETQSMPLPAAERDEAVREQENGAFREFVDDANDVLLSPFENIVSSDDAWVERGMPAFLALLVYGVGAAFLLNALTPKRR